MEIVDLINLTFFQFILKLAAMVVITLSKRNRIVNMNIRKIFSRRFSRCHCHLYLKPYFLHSKGYQKLYRESDIYWTLWYAYQEFKGFSRQKNKIDDVSTILGVLERILIYRGVLVNIVYYYLTYAKLDLATRYQLMHYME